MSKSDLFQKPLKASDVVREGIEKLEKMEMRSLDYFDFEFARGVSHCRYAMESVLVKILQLESDENATSR